MSDHGSLTTHVLDLSAGTPARGLDIQLHWLQADAPELLAQISTDDHGRSPLPLLTGETMRSGRYALTFHVGDYFRRAGLALPDPSFLDEVVVHFAIADPDQHYHVPLLMTPWSYSVYRGS